ncbi:hypothetical protein ACFQZZ_33185 [Nocardia sp. GCM10030253]|uniref:hypothetical protein n=1 Tax=Nocardia sp. GCM10030253 TaxID=3273404 RepID=UPI00362A34DA
MEIEVEAGRLALIEGALFHDELTDTELVVALRASGLHETARVLSRLLRLR